MEILDKTVRAGCAGHNERGGVALILLLLMTSAGAMLGALALRGAVSDVKMAGFNRQSSAGFYCAEAGLEAARGYFGNGYSKWGAIFDPAQPDPSDYPFKLDIDADGVPDVEVTLVDDQDEFAPLPNDPTRDNNLMAWMHARCVNPKMAPRHVASVIVVNVHETRYRYQDGNGSGHAKNLN